MVSFPFAFYNGFSATKVWEDMFYSLYNVTITNTDLLFWSILDMTLPYHVKNSYYLKSIPLVYKDWK